MKSLKNLLLSICALCSISVLIIACTEDEEPNIDITGVSFNEESVSIIQGTTVDLAEVLTVSGADADQAMISFSSADTSIISITGDLLTAVAEGSTTVTATEANSGLTASVTVTVTVPEEEEIEDPVTEQDSVIVEEPVILINGISLNVAEVQVDQGDTTRLTATIEPDSATNTPTVTWSIALTQQAARVSAATVAEDYATVDSTGLVTGILACEGCVTVTASVSEGDSTYTASAVVSVKSVAVTGITLSANEFNVNEGETQQVTATVEPANASNTSITWSITTSSDNCNTNTIGVSTEQVTQQVLAASRAAVAQEISYATVDENGLVTGVNQNGCNQLTLVATSADGVTASATFDVLEIPITSITLEPTTFDLNVNQTQQMVASILPANARAENITWSLAFNTVVCEQLTEAVAFQSVVIALPTVDAYATIDQNGLITGVSGYTGNCGAKGLKVVASYDKNVLAEATFNVVQPVTVSILNVNGGDAGESISTCFSRYPYELGVLVTPENIAANTAVTWSSNNSNVSVDSSGRVSFTGSGQSATITVTADGSGASDSVVISSGTEIECEF